MRWQRLVLAASAAFALIAIVVGSAAQTAASASGKNGRIVFRRYLDFDQTAAAIFTMNPDGTKVSRVTRPPRRVIDTEPDWSADGKMIAFERQFPCPAGGPRDGMDGTCDVVYTVKRDGKGVKPLVPCGFKANASFPGNCVGVNHPGWSPNGSKLAFQYNLVDDRYTRSLQVNAGIWIVDADGSDAHQITQRTPGNSWDHGVQWSPDGTRLAFFRLDLDTKKEAIYTVNVDGTSERRVTPAGLSAANPNWSPNGRWIVFSAETRNGAANVYKIHPDGTGLRNLTRQGRNGFHYLGPSFSPNSAMVTAGRTPGSGLERAADIVTMRADGSKLRVITKTRLWDSGADWGSAPLR